MTTSSDPQPLQQEGPERIFIHPTSAEWSANRWPLESDEYIEYVRVDLPRATAEAELTVVSALKELREMFPDTVRIYVSDDADYFDSVLAREAFILVGHDMFRALTLDEAMNQVRAWSKSRAATSEGEDTK